MLTDTVAKSQMCFQARTPPARRLWVKLGVPLPATARRCCSGPGIIEESAGEKPVENRRQGENHFFQNICFVTGSSTNSGISCLLNGRLSLFRLQTGIILLQLFPFQAQICTFAQKFPSFLEVLSCIFQRCALELCFNFLWALEVVRSW